ncbi:Tfp pilus assembly protein PilN [Jatrophihabitans endophyticus]|uniref:Tfp pilus assembly protein PilN n=1 Tax=Jatrophihabitans endophyticus TaxID=1206085 RepID=A0A1M5UF06_9ACTN|nr:hypothetical protein [Jatrophihabitans endophyticus]SHH61622.1 Tfp pilus assembly protein PilN [Jatrophihabitans endophyticus]
MTSTLRRPLKRPLTRTERTMPLRELTGATAVPVATVRANLMPPEVVGKRRIGWLRRRLGVALLALVVLVGAGYAFARQQTDVAHDDLAAAQDRSTALTHQVSGFDALLATQAKTTQLSDQLATVMATDLQWSRLLGQLNRIAPAGLTVTQVQGQLTDGTAATTAPTGTTMTAPGGAQVIGTLTISGTARDYRSVATYLDALAKVRGLALVDPGALATDQGRSTFTATASLTEKILGGRYTKSGGK